MRELKETEKQIENNMEIKEIFQKVEELEEENEQLAERLKEIDGNNKQLRTAMAATHE